MSYNVEDFSNGSVAKDLKFMFSLNENKVLVKEELEDVFERNNHSLSKFVRHSVDSYISAFLACTFSSGAGSYYLYLELSKKLKEGANVKPLIDSYILLDKKNTILNSSQTLESIYIDTQKIQQIYMNSINSYFNKWFKRNLHITSVLFNNIAENTEDLSSLSLYDLQTAVVRMGVFLREHEDFKVKDKRNTFDFGSQIFLGDMLSFTEEEIISWNVYRVCVEAVLDQLIADGAIVLAEGEANKRKVEYKKIQKAFENQPLLLMKELLNFDMSLEHSDFSQNLIALIKDSVQDVEGYNLTESCLKECVDNVKLLLPLFRHAQRLKLTNHAPTKQAKIMVLGDSVAAGLEAEKSWVTETKDNLNANDLPVLIANCSIPGAVLSQGCDVVTRELKFFKPEIILIALGGNDAYVGANMFAVFHNVLSLLTKIRDYSVDIPIVIGFGVPNTFPNASLYTDSFEDIINFLNGDKTSSIYKTFSLGCNEKHSSLLREINSDSSRISVVALPQEVLVVSNIHTDGIHPIKIDPITDLAVATLSPVVKNCLDEKSKVIRYVDPSRAARLELYSYKCQAANDMTLNQKVLALESQSREEVLDSESQEFSTAFPSGQVPKM